MAGGALTLTGLMASTSEARPCQSHYQRHQPRISIGFSFGSPSYYHHRGYYHYGYPYSHRYYRPRTIYYAPQRTYVVKPRVQRSKVVAQAQATLNELGYQSGKVDGLMGPQTRAAITRFQVASGIPATGTLDAKTRQWLAEYN